jgi:hypothetical protein
MRAHFRKYLCKSALVMSDCVHFSYTCTHKCLGVYVYHHMHAHMSGLNMRHSCECTHLMSTCAHTRTHAHTMQMLRYSYKCAHKCLNMHITSSYGGTPAKPPRPLLARNEDPPNMPRFLVAMDVMSSASASLRAYVYVYVYVCVSVNACMYV